LISMIQAKLELENVPRALRGAPIIFITAGLLSLGFMALDSALLKFLAG
jgi:Na+-translocating ferredoxin:NAD+ oxidoreductase subunit A